LPHLILLTIFSFSFRCEQMTDSSISKPQAVSLLVVTALLWSTGGILVKSINLNPFAIAGARSLIAALVIMMKIRKPLFTWSPYQWGGAVTYAATVILYVVANKLTTAANVVLLMYTAPLSVIAFAPWFLGEKSSVRDWLAVLSVMTGIVIFFLDKLSPAGFWGNILAVLSGICFGWMTLFLRKQKRGSPVESVLLGNLIAAAVGMPFLLGSEIPPVEEIGLLLALGVLQLGVSYLLYSRAIKHVEAFQAVLVTMLEPILNPVWVFLLHGEQPGQWAIAGGILVLSTLAMHGLASSRSAVSSSR